MKLLENHLIKFQEVKDFDISKTPYGRVIERNKELKDYLNKRIEDLREENK